jgi:hypothetical protein
MRENIMNIHTFLSALQPVLHYSLHFLFPALLARVFFPSRWKSAWLIMIATMLVDLDHLLADPVFDPGRCGIDFHPLHSFTAIFIYVFMLFIPNTIVRIIATGLIFHMATDFQDCLWM